MPSSVDKNLDQPSVNLHTNEFASIVFAVRIALDLATTLTSITWATPSVLVESPSISPLSHRTMKPALLNFLRQRTKVELQICFRQVWQQPNCALHCSLDYDIYIFLGPRSSSCLGQAQYVLLKRRPRVFVRRRYSKSNDDHQMLQVDVWLAVGVYL